MQVERTAAGLKLAGELSFIEAPAVAEQAQAMLCEMSGEVSVDVSGLHSRSMVVLAVLLQLVRVARERSVRLTWSGVTPGLQAIFDLTDVSELLTTTAH